MPKVFYAQRLTPETIADIEFMSSVWGVSEAKTIETAFKRLVLLNNPDDPRVSLLNTSALEERQPILKPSADKL